MQRISKPHIVDLLRIFDNNRWFSPRIRYASVRSKPELIVDLKQHFVIQELRKGRLLFVPKRTVMGLPRIEYDLEDRTYLLDHRKADVPKQSRQKIRFSISHVPVTLDFSEFFEGHGQSRSLPSTQTAPVSSAKSQGRGIRSLPTVPE